MPQIDLEPDAAVQATPEVIEAIRRAQNLRWARAT
jgi:hypothetical protein